jgi:hypothetical protein
MLQALLAQIVPPIGAQKKQLDPATTHDKQKRKLVQAYVSYARTASEFKLSCILCYYSRSAGYGFIN